MSTNSHILKKTTFTIVSCLHVGLFFLTFFCCCNRWKTTRFCSLLKSCRGEANSRTSTPSHHSRRTSCTAALQLDASARNVWQTWQQNVEKHGEIMKILSEKKHEKKTKRWIIALKRKGQTIMKNYEGYFLRLEEKYHTWSVQFTILQDLYFTDPSKSAMAITIPTCCSRCGLNFATVAKLKQTPPFLCQSSNTLSKNLPSKHDIFKSFLWP